MDTDRMRWFNFGILVFLTLAIQSGLGRLVGVGPARLGPDLLLLLAMVVALRGPADQAPIACWILGLAKDLTSQAVLGSYAVGFGLLGLAIVRGRDLLYGDHPLTLIAITVISSLLAEHATLVVGLVHGESQWHHYADLITAMVVSAAITGLLAPYGQWLLMKLHNQIGLPRRRSYGR